MFLLSWGGAQPRFYSVRLIPEEQFLGDDVLPAVSAGQILPPQAPAAPALCVLGGSEHRGHPVCWQSSSTLILLPHLQSYGPEHLLTFHNLKRIGLLTEQSAGETLTAMENKVSKLVTDRAAGEPAPWPWQPGKGSRCHRSACQHGADVWAASTKVLQAGQWALLRGTRAGSHQTFSGAHSSYSSASLGLGPTQSL